MSNGEINRELQHLKRIFGLAMQAEKILRKPHVPLLEERNTQPTGRIQGQSEAFSPVDESETTEFAK